MEFMTKYYNWTSKIKKLQSDLLENELHLIKSN
jgi:hypothetical protein